MRSNMSVEQLIKTTDALVYMNAMKAGMAELKEQLAVIEETKQYQDDAVEQARKIIRRLDNQYRAIVKAVNAPADPNIVEEDWSVLSEEEINGTK